MTQPRTTALSLALHAPLLTAALMAALLTAVITLTAWPVVAVLMIATGALGVMGAVLLWCLGHLPMGPRTDLAILWTLATGALVCAVGGATCVLAVQLGAPQGRVLEVTARGVTHHIQINDLCTLPDTGWAVITRSGARFSAERAEHAALTPAPIPTLWGRPLVPGSTCGDLTGTELIGERR